MARKSNLDQYTHMKLEQLFKQQERLEAAIASKKRTVGQKIRDIILAVVAGVVGGVGGVAVQFFRLEGTEVGRDPELMGQPGEAGQSNDRERIYTTPEQDQKIGMTGAATMLLTAVPAFFALRKNSRNKNELRHRREKNYVDQLIIKKLQETQAEASR